MDGAIAKVHNPEHSAMTDQASILAQLEALRAENAKLKALASAPKRITFKVSEKGAISVYGLGRFPFTFYASQFDALFSDDTIATLRAFRKANASKLAVKD